MGIFQRIFGSEDGPTDVFPWKPLKDPAGWKRLLNQELPQRAVVFKHSTRCGISSMMLRRFERNWADHAKDTEFYLLDLIAQRDLSEAIARDLELRHESPQVIVLEGGRMKRSASHGGIAGVLPERP